MEANIENCERMLSIIKMYCQASGQKMNLEKSSIVFSSNTTVEKMKQMSEKLSIPVAESPGIYLGIPSL